MAIWNRKKHQKCDHCGKPVVSGSVGSISSSTQIINDQTGEILCAECVLKMMADFAPDNEDTPDARILITKLTGEVANRTGLPNLAFRVKCEAFLTSDVEVSRQSDYYDVKWYKFISDIEPAVDYVVNWIKEHPLSASVLLKIKESNEILKNQNRFVLFYVPAGVPIPKPAFIQEFLNNILPMTQFHERSWRVVKLPEAPDSEKRAYMEKAIKNWIAAQPNQANLLFDQKIMEYDNGDQITCIIAYLREG